MEQQGGRKNNRELVKRSELVMQQLIPDAVENHKYSLVSQVPRHLCQGRIRSAMAVPVMRENNCYGVFYIDNSVEHEHYTNEDLDYMVLLSIQTAALIEKL